MKKQIFGFLLLSLTSGITPYAYLPDDMSLSDALIVISHNGAQAKAYGWRYYQQLGTLEQQWNAGSRGDKINLHWRLPMSTEKQLTIKTLWTDQQAIKAQVNILKQQLGIRKPTPEQLEKEKLEFLNIVKNLPMEAQEPLFLEFNKRFEKKLSGFEKIKLKTKLRRLQLKYQAAKNKMKAAKKLLPKQEPFIGLCHEGNGSNNCLISATLQKKGKIMKAEDYFKVFAQLLRNNPNDIAIIILESYLNDKSELNGAMQYSDDQVRLKLEAILKTTGLAQFALKLDKKYYGQMGGQKWPTIGELRKTGKRLLIFINDDSTAQKSDILNTTSHDPYRSTHWAFDWKKDMETGACKILRNNRNAQGFVVDHGPEASIPKSSKKGKLVTLFEKWLPKIEGGKVEATDYKFLNSPETIRKRLNQCAKASPGTPPNIFKIDFIEIAPEGKPVYETIKKINTERIEKRGLPLKE